jgi:prefoldin subunit 5
MLASGLPNWNFKEKETAHSSLDSLKKYKNEIETELKNVSQRIAELESNHK